MRVGLIYGLYDSFTEELRYVGQTWCPLGRRLKTEPSKSIVAEKLGISESTVYKKLAKAGIQLPKLKTGPKPRVTHG